MSRQACAASSYGRPYVAYYRVEGEDIRILRFLHGRRDVRQVMGRELDEQ
jgi:plasmid stabilization system protein ParE